MYQVYCDSYLLYDDAVDDLKIFSPKVELELNKTGSFAFAIYPDHPYYSMIKKLKSIITVYQNNFLIFRGRVLNDELGFYNEKQVSCEGELAFLIDSIQRPFTFEGTVAAFLQRMISNHNSQVDAAKQFTVGIVQISANLAVSEGEYTNTWEEVNKRLIGAFGGFIWVRHETNGNFIDYLSDFNTSASQSVTFGKNLLDLKRTSKGEGIATAIIPLGAKLEGSESRLTIESVNGGKDYVFNQDAVTLYGWIYRTEIFDDITSASILKTKAETLLNEQSTMFYNMELSAADLASSNTDFASFRLGTYVTIESEPHFGSTSQRHLIEKLSIDLLNPAANKLTIGALQTGLIDNVKHDQELIVQNIQGTLESKIMQETISRASSMIDQSAEEILLEVSEGYFLKASGEELGQQVSGLSTRLTQTATDFTMQFTQVNSNIGQLGSEIDQADADISEMHQYIRFVAGNIILGESGNELTLKIENDKITFFDGFEAVAYFSNGKLYVTDGEFTNSLRLGNFAFNPRSNGNLSLAKVV